METKAKKIKLIVLDVDGTLTDGKIYLDNNGVEAKAFNVKDGFSIVNAFKQGIKFGIITGRKSKLVELRAKELKIEDVYQGIENKLEKLEELLNKYSLNYDELAYMGDDINDTSIMKKIGFSGAPADADEEATNVADFISKYDGGKGAVREFVTYILKSQNLWKNVLDSYNF